MIAVVEHEHGCALDRFGAWLPAVRTVRPYLGESLPSSVDGLIVLGGQMSAYDDEVAPWLPAVRDLLASCVERSLPVLGICLGAQLLAVAAGGEVAVGDPRGRESGVVDVRWRAEAAGDALVSGLPSPFPGPSMHADAVTALPSGAAWLAESDQYPYQAFRVGVAAWGVQFHPEVSLATFRDWAEHHEEVDTAAVTSELTTRDGEVAQAGRALAGRFASLVAHPSR